MSHYDYRKQRDRVMNVSRRKLPFVRRLTSKSQLVLEIAARRAGGRQFERRLVLEKQEEGSYEGNR